MARKALDAGAAPVEAVAQPTGTQQDVSGDGADSDAEAESDEAEADVSEQVAEVVIPDQADEQVAEIVEEADEGQADESDEAEAEVDPFATHLAMIHPDGGRCDAYEPDEDGVHMVPLADVPTMLSHGFERKED